jgi:hypothetical protein
MNVAVALLNVALKSVALLSVALLSGACSRVALLESFCGAGAQMVDVAERVCGAQVQG